MQENQPTSKIRLSDECIDGLLGLMDECVQCESAVMFVQSAFLIFIYVQSCGPELQSSRLGRRMADRLGRTERAGRELLKSKGYSITAGLLQQQGFWFRSTAWNDWCESVQMDLEIKGIANCNAPQYNLPEPPERMPYAKRTNFLFLDRP